MKPFALSILQQGSYEKLNPGIFFQEYVQPNAPQVAKLQP